MAIDKAKKEKANGDYSAKDISVLEGLEPVRKRPGMYIGTTGIDGLHHLIWEIFDNARDEAMGGFADRVEVALLPNNQIRVVDNGRGIPVDVHKQTKVSALETIMTTLHAGGKFGGEGYKISGGLHGVGASVVNALSVFTRVDVHKGGDVYVQEYSQGKKKASVKKIAKTKMNGSIILFQPDPEIFKEIAFSYETVLRHLRQQAYLVKGMRITVLDARGYEGKLDLDKIFYLKDLGLDIPSTSFYFEGGLLSLVKFHNQNQKHVHKNIFYTEKILNDKGEAVEVALQYVDDISARITSFANNIPTIEGGMHLTGFKSTLTRTLNTYARKSGLLKEKDENFTGDDVLEGITAVISVKLADIQFEGQTKAKLGSVEARGMVETVFGEEFNSFLEENPDDAKAIINKVTIALRARKAARMAKDSVLRKGLLEGMTLPGKLADCQSDQASETELFIVEGDSAGGSAKQGRDRRTQAILPLRGKILNVERARLDKMLASQEIKNLVIALGTAIGDTFDVEKLRYHKIIIATDADVDGDHIKTLLLTLFYRHFRPVIDGGYLYVAKAPLYKIARGKEVTYVYSDQEKEDWLKENKIELEEEKEILPEGFGNNQETEEEPEEETEAEKEKVKIKRASKVSIQRYKGLGEMNPDELYETTMDASKRLLKKIFIEDAQRADETFDILMGSQVAPRKSFIQSNAKIAEIDYGA
ncbi:MAG: DNA topoisomerase subunit B [Patescibacteria group bacterium]